MRKFLLLVLVAGILFSAVPCFAEGDTHSQIIYTEIVNNTSGASTATAIPITKIRVGVDKVIGMSVMALSATAATAAVFDSNVAAISATTEMIAECEATVYKDGGVMFPFPRSIVNGVAVVQNDQSRVIVYYIRS